MISLKYVTPHHGRHGKLYPIYIEIKFLLILVSHRVHCISTCRLYVLISVIARVLERPAIHSFMDCSTRRNRFEVIVECVTNGASHPRPTYMRIALPKCGAGCYLNPCPWLGDLRRPCGSSPSDCTIFASFGAYMDPRFSRLVGHAASYLVDKHITKNHNN